MKAYILAGAVVLGSLMASSAYADDQDQCNSDCPPNQTKVGFADGERATCICVEESAGMDETVPDYTVQAPGPNDGEPLGGSSES